MSEYIDPPQHIRLDDRLEVIVYPDLAYLMLDGSQVGHLDIVDGELDNDEIVANIVTDSRIHHRRIAKVLYDYSRTQPWR